jgi:hypothetical protein
MGYVSSEIYENSKLLFKERYNKFFLIKIVILFFVYMFSNYLFDRMDNEDLKRTFLENPHITIQIPNNITFKILITFGMIIISHFAYQKIVKPFIYPKK